MERTKWTDDLLDARMGSIDKQQDRLFQEIQILRTEVHREISGVRAELATFRQQVIWLIGGLAVSLAGMLGAGVIQLLAR